MRQPNAKNCSSVSARDSSRKMPPEKKKPIGAPSCGNMPYQARLPGRRVLDGEQHRAAPFAAQAEPLAEAAQREQQRRGDADRRVRRQQADRHRRHAHRQQRGDERGLAADAVAEVTEERRADRAGEERDGEGRQRRERRRRRIGRRERTAAGTRAPRRWRRCRSRRTRSSCRSGWRTAPAPGC